MKLYQKIILMVKVNVIVYGNHKHRCHFATSLCIFYLSPMAVS